MRRIDNRLLQRLAVASISNEFRFSLLPAIIFTVSDDHPTIRVVTLVKLANVIKELEQLFLFLWAEFDAGWASLHNIDCRDLRLLQSIDLAINHIEWILCAKQSRIDLLGLFNSICTAAVQATESTLLLVCLSLLATGETILDDELYFAIFAKILSSLFVPRIIVFREVLIVWWDSL